VFVGLTSRFKESMFMLARLVGWPTHELLENFVSANVNEKHLSQVPGPTALPPQLSPREDCAARPSVLPTDRQVRLCVRPPLTAPAHRSPDAGKSAHFGEHEEVVCRAQSQRPGAVGGGTAYLVGHILACLAGGRRGFHRVSAACGVAAGGAATYQSKCVKILA